MSYKNARIRKCHGPRVLQGLTLDGAETVVLENELLRIMVNLSRGAMVTEFLHKPSDLDVLYKIPSGIRPYGSYTPCSTDVSPFSENHPEGWFECFPSGSIAVKQDGASIGFHGEIWGQPFELEAVSESAGECSIRISALTLRTPWKLTKTLSLKRNDPALFVEETALNLGADTRTIMWGQHPVFGAPFLDGRCVIQTDAKVLLPQFDKKEAMRWPIGPEKRDFSKVAAPSSGQGKMIYLTEFKTGRYRIVSPSWKLAFELNWNTRDFPWCWVCETARNKGWGEYFLAMEPFTGLPKAIETGQGVISVAPKKSKTVRFEARIVPQRY